MRSHVLTGTGRRFALSCKACAAALVVLGSTAASGTDLDEAFECVVMPYRVFDLSSGVSGRLDRVHVERADKVSEGQILAALESKVERANLEFARARARMKSELMLREASLVFDERSRARLDNLHARRVASEQEKDEAERAAELGHWQVALAKDNRHLAALEARRAEALLELRTVSSPFDGVVMERFKSPGEYVDEEPIVRVAQLGPLRVEVIVPIGRSREFRSGLDAWVYAETDPERPWRAAVTAVDAVGDPASGTFRARLELPNPGQQHLAGIRCTARLSNSSVVESIAVDPAPAARHVGDPPTRIWKCRCRPSHWLRRRPDSPKIRAARPFGSTNARRQAAQPARGCAARHISYRRIALQRSTSRPLRPT